MSFAPCYAVAPSSAISAEALARMLELAWTKRSVETWALAAPGFVGMLAASYVAHGPIANAEHAATELEWTRALLALNEPLAPMLDASLAQRAAWSALRATALDLKPADFPRTLEELRAQPFLSAKELALALHDLLHQTALRMQARAAHHAAAAREELERVSTTFMPALAPELVPTPAESASGDWELVDDEGVRCVFTSMSFGDRGMARALASDTRVYAAHASITGLSRVEAAHCRAVRRAVACGFDARLAAPAYLNPETQTAPKPDAFAARIDRTMDALFGKNRFDWSAAEEHNEAYMHAAFAHCESEGEPANAEEAQKLAEFTEWECIWRLTLLRVTGSVGCAEDGCAAYHAFRELWRACHSGDGEEAHPPPAHLRAEAGGAAFAAFLGMKRAFVGSLELDTLKAAAFAKFGATATSAESAGAAADVLARVAGVCASPRAHAEAEAEEEVARLWPLVYPTAGRTDYA